MRIQPAKQAERLAAPRATTIPQIDPVALSRCHAVSAKGLRLADCQAAATASRHVLIATAWKVRCN
jgi:predicted nucleic acid-binding protein